MVSETSNPQDNDRSPESKHVFLYSKRFFLIGQGKLTQQSMVGPILTSIKVRTSVANLQQMMLYNRNIELVNDNVYTNLIQFCPFILKIWSKNQF